MIDAIIRASLENRAVYCCSRDAHRRRRRLVPAHAVDALPDLSDVQSSCARRTRPGAATGRGPGDLPAHDGAAVGTGCHDRARYSFYGDSFVNVLFEDGRTRTGRARACSST